jgi:uncharacterized protein (DUF427 family)
MKKRIKPGKGQESVWDYPRPPRLLPTSKHLEVYFNGKRIASTSRAYRVLETSHPPVYYLPPADISMEYLQPSPRPVSSCEFKGKATYWDLKVGNAIVRSAAWSYQNPTSSFADIKGYLAFYPSKMELCKVDGEKARPQEGDFYGGWITSDIVGPFKGGAGTWGW